MSAARLVYDSCGVRCASLCSDISSVFCSLVGSMSWPCVRKSFEKYGSVDASAKLAVGLLAHLIPVSVLGVLAKGPATCSTAFTVVTQFVIAVAADRIIRFVAMRTCFSCITEPQHNYIPGLTSCWSIAQF